MTQWYYADASHQRQGPIAEADLTRLREEGRISAGTLVWREGMAQWSPLGELAGEFGDPVTPIGASAPPPVLAAATGTVAVAAESPYAPPAAPLLRDAHVHVGGEVVYAGFWKRVAAYLIDGFVLGIGGGIVGGVIGGVMGASMGLDSSGGLASGGLLAIQAVSQIAGLLIGASYFGWMHSSAQQASLGKMAVGIKVVRGNGERISFWRGFGRYFGLILSAILLGIGFLMAAFTERKRALHDMLCDTLVVDKWAYSEHPEWQKRELGTVTVVILVLGGLFTLAMILVFGAMFVALASSAT